MRKNGEKCLTISQERIEESEGLDNIYRVDINSKASQDFIAKHSFCAIGITSHIEMIDQMKRTMERVQNNVVLYMGKIKDIQDLTALKTDQPFLSIYPSSQVLNSKK